MNPITDRIRKGTVGELLVQLRLLEHQVQAAPPLKDSGNDLIAIRGKVFRAIQVKTTTKKVYSKKGLPEHFHILAVVQLVGDDVKLHLDKSQVFLIPWGRVKAASPQIKKINEFKMTNEHVDYLFGEF